MKYSKQRSKITTDNPIHKLYEAANDIVKKSIQAYNEAAIPMPNNLTLPIWVDGDPAMKITIEIGSKTTADYAIFKAQHQSGEK